LAVVAVRTVCQAALTVTVYLVVLVAAVVDLQHQVLVEAVLLDKVLLVVLEEVAQVVVVAERLQQELLLLMAVLEVLELRLIHLGQALHQQVQVEDTQAEVLVRHLVLRVLMEAEVLSMLLQPHLVMQILAVVVVVVLTILVSGQAVVVLV
jgi:hypothetical protein